MRKDLPYSIQISRCFLLVGVMIGLFFSSGEGVRLLPFSADSETPKGILAKPELGSSKSYSYSVHNFSSQSFTAKNKTQKSFKDLSYFVLNGNEGKFGTIRFFGEVIIQNYSQAVFFNNSEVTARPSDRAPPLV